MARIDVFDGLVPFITIVDAGSLRNAAKTLRVTASAVSKALAKLETDVGVRLLNRTSRSVTLTSEGESFLRVCRDAIQKVRAARDELSEAQRAPRGRLRVSLPPQFAQRVVEALPRLMSAHPALTIDIVETDRFVQLADENIDVAIRIGASDDSTNVVRKLRVLDLVTAASAAYLERHGTPRTPKDLEHHSCLRFVLPSGMPQPWFFQIHDKPTIVRVSGTLTADHGESLLAAAKSGMGLLQAPDVMLTDAFERGELIQVLASYAASGPPLSALCTQGRQHSAKVRAFVDFVDELIAVR